jgi:hypothetical protein
MLKAANWRQLPSLLLQSQLLDLLLTNYISDRLERILTMYVVQNSQNYWVFGRFPSSDILENTTFQKLDLFPSSDEGGGEDTYSVGPLRKS